MVGPNWQTSGIKVDAFVTPEFGGESGFVPDLTNPQWNLSG